MNREQASNILDAYVSVCYALDADGNTDSDAKKARKSLREVILDAMTGVRYYPITYPNITTSPSTMPYKPNVTWTSAVETGQMEMTANE